MSKKNTLHQFFKSSSKEPVEEEKKDTGQIVPEIDITNTKIIPEFEVFMEGLGSWKTLMSAYNPKMKTVHQYVKQQYANNTCFPPPHEIFNAFRQTPLDQLKVVIVGQDPYINHREAMGLCFSVPEGTKIPPSLMNIYKNLATNIPNFRTPKHGDLTKWANQGVLLLNTVLTVESGKSNSHKNCGWTGFTDEVIKVIDQECTGLVFLLWGKPAQLKAKKVNRTKHHVFETSHPSPLAAHAGFLDSKHFLECNVTLERLGKEPIDWTIQ